MWSPVPNTAWVRSLIPTETTHIKMPVLVVLYGRCFGIILQMALVGSNRITCPTGLKCQWRVKNLKKNHALKYCIDSCPVCCSSALTVQQRDVTEE